MPPRSHTKLRELNVVALEAGAFQRVCLHGLGAVRAIAPILAAFAGLVILSRGHAHPDGSALSKDLIVLLALWWLALVTHEAGHVLAARIHGIPVLAVRILWFGLRWSGSTQVFTWSLQRWQGGGATLIDAGENRHPRQMLLFFAGGCVGNLLAALGALLLWAQTAADYALVAAILNVAMLISNLLPAGTSIETDGTRMLLLFNAMRGLRLEARSRDASKRP